MPRPPRPKAEHACWVRSLALIIPLAFAPSLRAATVITGDVTPALPWNSSTSPQIGVFGAGTLSVDGGSQLSTNSATLGYYAGSTGTATITGAGSGWSSSSELRIGRSGNGTLNVEAGGQVSNAHHAYLGYDSGSTGTATITGAGSRWINGDRLHVGNFGSGTLRAEAGAQVSSTSGLVGSADGSTATITGAGSMWTNSNEFRIGRAGSGALQVEAGAQVSSVNGYLGDNIGTTGTVTVTGAGSKWTNTSTLFVDYFGSGVLTVEDGGRVTTGMLFASLGDLHGNGTIEATTGAVLDGDMLFNAAHPTQAVLGFGAGGTLTVTVAGGSLGAGYDGVGSLTIAEGAAVSGYAGYLGRNQGSTGTATITGAGSKWTSSDTLYIGNDGSGTLRVEAGGQVSDSNGTLASDSGATGIATITGAGSKWTNSYAFSVGGGGSAQLRVEAGGQVSNVYGTIGYSAGSTGSATITGAGSKWTNTGGLDVGRSGIGALRVEAGGLVSVREGSLGDLTGSTGTATITGVGSKWTNSSTLRVGNFGSGALTITAGGLVSVRGILTIDSNGGNDSFINMTTGGMLALWGDADDSLAQFLGLVAGSDAIRYWNAGLANWSPLTAATLGSDYTLQYQGAGELTGYTLLTVLAPGPPGDFDFDGRVDGADFLAWQRGNSPMPNSPEDLATWRTNVGLGATTPVVTPATTAVPEPGALALAGLAWAGLLLSGTSTHVRKR